MINLRYHIVSIVAVFLALGIGVALGSSFVDGFVVQTLRNNVDTLEADRSELRDQVGLLEDELDATRASQVDELETLLPLSTSRRLTDRPVMIIATQGADTDAWEVVRDALIDASANYEGTLWLSDRLDPSLSANRAPIAEALGLVNDQESVVRPALLLRLSRALFQTDQPETAEPAAEGPDAAEGEPAADPATTLEALRDAALVSFDNDRARTGALADVPIPGPVYVILGGGDVALTPDQLLLPLLHEALDEELDPFAVVVEPRPADTEVDRDVYVSAIRTDEVLRREFATIDSVDTFDGVLSLVLLAERGEASHVGVAESAASRLPEP